MTIFRNILRTDGHMHCDCLIKVHATTFICWMNYHDLQTNHTHTRLSTVKQHRTQANKQERWYETTVRDITRQQRKLTNRATTSRGQRLRKGSRQQSERQSGARDNETSQREKMARKDMGQNRDKITRQDNLTS